MRRISKCTLSLASVWSNLSMPTQRYVFLPMRSIDSMLSSTFTMSYMRRRSTRSVSAARSSGMTSSGYAKLARKLGGQWTLVNNGITRSTNIHLEQSLVQCLSKVCTKIPTRHTCCTAAIDSSPCGCKTALRRSSWANERIDIKSPK